MNRDMVVKMIVLVAGCAFSACSRYPNDHVPFECLTRDDCNPVRTCGELIECVGGRCDPSRTVLVPCDARCQVDRDCVLADRDCCCGDGVDDYVAILREDLSAWLDRPQCRDVACPEEDCTVPGGVQAVCRDGQCLVETDESLWDVCATDADCVKVPSGCPGCDCAGGYEEKAIHRDYRAVYLEEQEQRCAAAGACRLGPYGVNACTNRPAVCVAGRCRVPGEDCGCPQNWNPVCALFGEERISFPNSCQTECLGLSWRYHGLCACERACLDPTPVCADNGVTYWCGAEEATCSRLPVRYPGDCIAACEYCEELERPRQPVCGEDGRTYLDVCYAECHDIRWWHTGECIPGEQDACDAGGTTAIPCPDDRLFCLVDQYCPDCPGCACPGTCIATGHCMRAADCASQPLDHEECTGYWRCAEHTCTWQCRD